MNAKANIPELLNTLVNGDLEERVRAGLAVKEFGSEAVEPLLELLANPENSNSWSLIADALGDIGDGRAVEPLIKLLKSSASYDVLLARKYSAWALGNIKDPRAVDVLIEIIQEHIFVEAIDGSIVDESDEETVDTAIWALTEIGDLRALEPIIQRIFEDRYHDGSVLTKWGEPAFTLLAEALRSDDDDKRMDAASLLGGFGDSQAVPLLIELLRNDENKNVRYSAAYSLSTLRDARVLDALIIALDDSYDQVRIAAAVGLSHLKDIRSVDALKKATQDENATVRKCARQALESVENASID